MPNNPYPEEDELTIDLRDVWHTITKNVKFIRNVTAGCIVLAGIYLVVVPPTFESVAMLRVKQPQGLGSSLLESMPMGNAMASKQLMSTYAEILKSRSVVVPVIEAMEKPNKEGKYPDYEGYIKGGRIVTNPFKDTEIMTVTYTAETPEDAQKGNQLLVDGFLKRLTGITRDQQRTTRTFLEARVGDAKKDLDKNEDALNKFQKENKILAPDAEVKMAADKLALADKLKAENKVALASGNARAGAANSALSGQAKRMADNSVIKSYNQKLAALEAERISYATKYTQKHPAMIKINQDIAEMEQKLNQAIANVANGNAASDNPAYNVVLGEKFKGEAEASIAQSNLVALDKVEKDYKEDIEKLSDNQRIYLGLMRDRNVAQEIYVMLAKRLEEAKVAEVSVASEVQVVDAPTFPEKRSKPKRGLTLIIAALLGMFGSAGIVVAKSLMNMTVKTSDDVERYLDLPVLGQIPSVESLEEAKEVEDMSAAKKLWRALWKK